MMSIKTDKPIVMMFSGQGSQHYHMGRTLYQSHGTFYTHLTEMDRLIYSQLGWSLIPSLHNEANSKQHLFDDLSISHMAIFAVEVALARTLMAHGVKPAAVLGVSIGEVAAMVIASALDVPTAIEAVWTQSQQIIRHCPKAAMVAVLAPLSVYETKAVFAGTTLAAVNFDTHFIVSAELDKAAALEQTLKADGVTYQRLPVRYGFHSPLIAPAANDYLKALQAMAVQAPQVTYYSCAYGARQHQLPYSHPWDAVWQPIALQRTFQQLNQLSPCHLIDVGPASTLATMAKYALPSETPHQISGIMSPMGNEVDKLERLLSHEL